MGAELVHVQFKLRENVVRALQEKKAKEGCETWNSLFELMLLDSAAQKNEVKSVIERLLDTGDLTLPKRIMK